MCTPYLSPGPQSHGRCLSAPPCHGQRGLSHHAIDGAMWRIERRPGHPAVVEMASTELALFQLITCATMPNRLKKLSNEVEYYHTIIHRVTVSSRIIRVVFSYEYFFFFFFSVRNGFCKASKHLVLWVQEHTSCSCLINLGTCLLSALESPSQLSPLQARGPDACSLEIWPSQRPYNTFCSFFFFFWFYVNLLSRSLLASCQALVNMLAAKFWQGKSGTKINMP